jgi:arylsulfatase A-like enzyme
MGFDYFYGFVGGDANQWQPNLFRNTTQIFPYYNNPGWNLITAMADDAIEYLDRVTAINPDQPFFIYYVPGAVHAPHHPTPEWIKKISDMHLFDGVRQGMAISWPKVITDKGGIRNQFHHVIDIVPTILEATDIKAPEVVDGIPQKPIEGVSMMYTFDKKNANAPSTHRTQYFEMMGDHAIYHDGWIASTKVMRPPWDVAGAVSQDPAGFPYDLYDLTKDWTQYENLAEAAPREKTAARRSFLLRCMSLEMALGRTPADDERQPLLNVDLP